MSPLITVRSPELVIPAEPPKVPNDEADPRGIGVRPIGARQFPTAGPAAGNCLAPIGLTPIPLGSASSFGTFGGSAGMTNSGLLTVINGDIGTTAVSTAVTGFHDAGPQCIYTETPLNIGTVNGKIYTAAPPPTVDRKSV